MGDILGLLVAVLGLIAACLALITEGIKLYREFPTSTPPFVYPTENTEVLVITEAPIPTQPPIVTEPPLVTEPPAVAPLPTTPPNTILDVGQVWRQGGLELIMAEAQEWGYGVDTGLPPFSFHLTNLKPYDRSFRIYLENFSAIDNRGFNVRVLPDYMNLVMYPDCTAGTIELPANGTVDLQSGLLCLTDYGRGGPDVLRFVVDLGDTSITEVIVSVSVSSITNARWRIPINH